MRRAVRRAARPLAVALLAGSAAAVPPAAGDPVLGGYTASAEAAIVRIGVFEPAIPIPADPQVDASIGFARATTTTGPSSRGLASYLWPGDAVGDGLGVLLGNEKLDYPVKTSSSFPATDNSPSRNAVQIDDGNGMSTAADGRSTRATVVGLGLGNGIGGVGSGLCRLVKKCPQTPPPTVDLPDPIAAAATVEDLKSQSTVALGTNGITATAHSVASGISLLGGLITIDGLDLRSESTSDGTTGTAAGTSRITGLHVLGREIDLGGPVSIGGRPAPVPQLPQVLRRLGITVTYLESQRSRSGPLGSLHAEGLTITVDVAPLRKALAIPDLSGPLTPVLSSIDQAGPVLLGLLKLGTKIVVTVGDVRTSASAAPGYTAPGGTKTPPAVSPTGAGVPPASGQGVLPGIATGPVATVTPPVMTAVPASFDLPGLGRVPVWFVLAGLSLVALVAWTLRAFGAWIFGGGSCVLGKSVGVPDLRKVSSS